MPNEKETSYKEFLSGFLKKENVTKTPEPQLPEKTKHEGNFNSFVPETSNRVIKPRESVIRAHEYDRSKYEEVLLSDLPMGFMYPEQTRILLRPCKTKEIQDFSTYDKQNPFDFKNKLNDIIESCVIYERPDGSLCSYNDLMDGDRVFLIYMIREKTFVKGNVLTTKVKYEHPVTKEILSETIELKRQNLDIYRDEKIMQWFDDDKKAFVFHTKLRDEPFVLAPPTIGLKNCFDQFFSFKFENDKIDKIKDVPFFKIAPYLKPGISYMSYEELENLQRWFEEEITPEEYSTLLQIIDEKLLIGIRGLKKNTAISTVRAPRVYPVDPSSLFIIPDSFDLFVEEPNHVSQ